MIEKYCFTLFPGLSKKGAVHFEKETELLCLQHVFKHTFSSLIASIPNLILDFNHLTVLFFQAFPFHKNKGKSFLLKVFSMERAIYFISLKKNSPLFFPFNLSIILYCPLYLYVSSISPY